MNNFTYSKQGLALTESFEGVRLTAYPDVKGVLTIGYGHITGVHAGMTCTQAQAEAWLQQDIQWASDRVNAEVHISLTQPEFDSLVDFVFNCGCGNFDNSTLLKLINKDDLTDAANEFDKWDEAGGKVVAGLLRRRQAEDAMFSGS